MKASTTTIWRSLFLTMLASLLVCSIVRGQEKWVLNKDKNGIKVFTRKVAGFRFEELKVECVFEGRMSQLAAVLMDVNNHYKWVYKTIKSQLLSTINLADLIFYTEVESPWPFQNRDAVVRMNLVQNAVSRIITSESRNLNDYLPPKPDIVRMKYSKVTWIIAPINDKLFNVEYRIQIDPGGAIPGWLLNMFITKGPYESFMKLKEAVKLPQYANAKFPFLSD